MRLALFSVRLCVAPFLLAAEEGPRLADFAKGQAEWVIDAPDVGLPMGESDTVVLPDGRVRSYLHASTDSGGIRDSKGRRVEFPGCTTAWDSKDGGKKFKVNGVCLFDGHTEQQQYPRVAEADDGTMYMVYEWEAKTMLRVADDEGAL